MVSNDGSLAVQCRCTAVMYLEQATSTGYADSDEYSDDP